jgi:Tat protein secretion system quality control protein TatD with DNase activity
VPIEDATGKAMNHPLNLRLCLEALAADRGLHPEALAEALERNVERLFL